MSGDDDLRRRLRDVDPARPDGPTVPHPGPTAHDILERAMRTADEHHAGTSRTTTTGARRLATGSPPRRGRGPLVAAGLAAAAVALVAGGVVLSGTLGDDDTPTAGATVVLTAAPSDSTSSCLVFDVAVLAQMPTALAGTVTAVDGGTVTVEVERWYRGGTAEVVTVRTDERGAALGGVDFVAGEDYLLTAGRDGVVSSCGYSGPATPQLRSAFDEAFGG